MASALLVAVGLLTNSVVPISIAGLIWLVPLFIAFLFTDRLMFWLKAFREGRLSYLYFVGDLKLSEETKSQIDSAWNISIGFAGVLRALVLSATFWVVDLFSSLMDGGSSTLLEQIRRNFILSTLSLTTSAIDLSRGKSIKSPGFFLKAIAVFGAICFFRGLLLLVAGLGGIQDYRAMKALFSSPVWFLSQENGKSIVHWIMSTDITSRILVRVVMPFLFFAVSMDMLRLPTTKDNVDAKNFALAIVITSVWFASQWLAFFSASF
jgi:hypothetical protein